MSKESFELDIEFPIVSPLKEESKKKIIEELSSLISEKDNTTVSFSDSHYMDKRGAEFLEAAHFVFEVASPYIGMAGMIIGIISFLKNRNGGKINIKKKDGTSVSIDSNMSEDEVKAALDKNEQ